MREDFKKQLRGSAKFPRLIPGMQVVDPKRRIIVLARQDTATRPDCPNRSLRRTRRGEHDTGRLANMHEAWQFSLRFADPSGESP